MNLDHQERRERVNLVDNIKAICRDKNISIADLERRAGVSENSMFRWNKHQPSIDKVKNVADVLKVTVDELLK